MKLLCLSNGHGEDIIAVQIIRQLQLHPQSLDIAALPLVGEGYAYRNLGIPIIAPVQSMPSGGFIYMDGRQLGRDLRGGLLQLTWAQYQAVRKWGSSPGEGKILAVGDIVPLLFAWLSGVDYSFVGTARSEYYLRDEGGWLPQTSRFERWMGSAYHPLDRWLMGRPRCQGVFPRDTLTTKILQQWSVPAFDLGNPMMDGIGERKIAARDNDRPLTILLLPGSRIPEAEQNWQQILQGIAEVISNFKDRSVLFLGAIAPSLNLEPFQESLVSYGWRSLPPSTFTTPIQDPEALAFTHLNGKFLLSQHSYRNCLQAADFAIAMAGTATEQFAGLGKPIITIPGDGPQFTYRFAEAQTRLLGASVVLVKQPKDVAGAIKTLLLDPDRLQLIARNGKRRMGKPGAAKRIAQKLMELYRC